MPRKPAAKPKRKPPTKAQVRALLRRAERERGYPFADAVGTTIRWMLGQGEEPLR